MQVIEVLKYGGEMKKGIFCFDELLLTIAGIASMHCSANVGSVGDVAIFWSIRRE